MIYRRKTEPTPVQSPPHHVCTRHECNSRRASVRSAGTRKPVGHPPRPLRRRRLLLLPLHPSTVRSDASERNPRGHPRTCRSLLSVSVLFALSHLCISSLFSFPYLSISVFLSFSPLLPLLLSSILSGHVCSCPPYRFQQIASIIPFSLFSLRFLRACPTELLATSVPADHFSSLQSESFPSSGLRMDLRALFFEASFSLIHPSFISFDLHWCLP